MHFYFLNTITPTCFTSSAFNIERESSCFETTHLCIRGFLKQISDVIKHSCKRSRVASWCSTNRTLVNLNKLINILNSDNLIIRQRLKFRVVEQILQYWHESLFDE